MHKHEKILCGKILLHPKTNWKKNIYKSFLKDIISFILKSLY